MCVATGVVWTLVGILYSRASQRGGGSFVPFMAAYSLVFVLTTWTAGCPVAAPMREVALTGACELAAAFFGQLGFLALYLAMGWVALLIIYPMWLHMPHAAFWWILAEGVFYTIGSYFFNKDEEHAYWHAIWHVFITLGATSHTIATWLILQ